MCVTPRSVVKQLKRSATVFRQVCCAFSCCYVVRIPFPATVVASGPLMNQDIYLEKYETLFVLVHDVAGP